MDDSTTGQGRTLAPDSSPATPAREAAVGLVCTGASNAEIAAALGVRRETVWRWKQDPVFCGMVQQHRAQARDAAAGALVAAVHGAVSALVTIAADSASPARARVAAAVAILDRAGIPSHVEVRVTECCYLIEADGALKIGRSVDPVRRLRDLNTGSPVPLRLLATIEGGAAVEAQMHQRFAGLRLDGEWFRDCPEIRAAFGVPA